MNTRHVIERIGERVRDPNVQRIIIARLELAERTVPKTHTFAVYVFRDDVHHGDTDSVPYHERTESNGTNAVAIIRDGYVTTLFWRRDNQPKTASALKVDRVLTYREER